MRKIRQGRPRKITPELIAKAVIKVGFDSTAIRAVSEELGVTWQGLYNHAKTREELIAIACNYIYADLFKIGGEEKSFFEIIEDYAEKYYKFSLEFPELIKVVVSDGVRADRLFTSDLGGWLADLVTHGERDGMQPAHCYDVFILVSASVIGASAVQVSRREREGVVGPTVKVFFPRVVSNSDVHKLSSDQETDPYKLVQMTIFSLREKYSYKKNLG